MPFGPSRERERKRWWESENAIVQSNNQRELKKLAG
jgi:hypothetical protein